MEICTTPDVRNIKGIMYEVQSTPYEMVHSPSQFGMQSSSDRHKAAETRMNVPLANARAILKRWRIPVPV